MARTGYQRSEVQRALAEVRACNGNVSRAARNLGISRTTIQSWVSGSRQPEVVRDAETGGLNDGDLRAVSDFQQVRDLYADHLKKPEVVSKASAQQAATVVGIMEDKRRAILGKPNAGTGQSLNVVLVAPDGWTYKSLREASLAAIEEGQATKAADLTARPPEG